MLYPKYSIFYKALHIYESFFNLWGLPCWEYLETLISLFFLCTLIVNESCRLGGDVHCKLCMYVLVIVLCSLLNTLTNSFFWIVYCQERGQGSVPRLSVHASCWQDDRLAGLMNFLLKARLINFEHVHVYDLSQPLFTQWFKNENSHWGLADWKDDRLAGFMSFLHKARGWYILKMYMCMTWASPCSLSASKTKMLTEGWHAGRMTGWQVLWIVSTKQGADTFWNMVHI
jgi:hypothetical protein